MGLLKHDQLRKAMRTKPPKSRRAGVCAGVSNNRAAITGAVAGSWFFPGVGTAIGALVGCAVDLVYPSASGPVSAFYGFKEGNIAFPPTFKVQKGDVGFEYQGKRAPAWCDRVLWHSKKNRGRITCKKGDYKACPNVTSSDHKPVRCRLFLDIP